MLSLPQIRLSTGHTFGALAAEAFGEPWFGQGMFGVLQQGRVVNFNDAIGIPPHGAVIHLVRTSLQPRAGYSAWDTPADPGCILPFDYDICLGARGSASLTPSQGARLNSGSGAGPSSARATQPEPSSAEQTVHTFGRQLNRQITEVSSDLQVLITRLETAGVLPEATVAPWTDQLDPPETEADCPDRSSATLASTNHLTMAVGCWAYVLVTGQPSPSKFLALCVVTSFLPVSAEGHDSDGQSDEAEPSEPSSSSLLEDISAPTPVTSLVEVTDTTPVVAPSGDSLASTSVPGQSSLGASVPEVRNQQLTDIQHRFACALRGLPISTPTDAPFIPAGLPVIVHNPFLGRPQCRLRTTAQFTPQMLLTTLGDYSQRRGWQQMCDVQPQPNAEAVHLIPTAADPQLKSVILCADGGLHARCVNRDFPRSGSGAVDIAGRAGRVIAPYLTRQRRQGGALLRDGDCLPVSFGPYGPPPPQPASRSASVSPLPVLLGLTLVLHSRSGLLLGLTFLLASAMEEGVTPSAGGAGIYRVSAFPWRLPPAARTADNICDGALCRYSVLCPWMGPQGVHTAPTSQALEAVWEHFRDSLPGWPAQQYVPTWPGIRQDRLTIIPEPVSTDTACVVVHCRNHFRALLTPATIAYRPLLRLIASGTPWEPVTICLPPSLQAESVVQSSVPFRLRTGDVIEVREEGQQCQTFGHTEQAMLRGYAVWTQGIGILCTVIIRLWDVTWRRPIITWIDPGTDWQPDRLSFSGGFSESYPGLWIPLPWSPSKVLQMIRVAETPDRVHVMVERADRTFVTSVVRTVSRDDLAAALECQADAISIVGYDTHGCHWPCPLRNGDIVHVGLPIHSEVPIYGWPDDDCNAPRPTLPVGLALLGGRSRSVLIIAMLLQLCTWISCTHLATRQISL